MYMYVCVCVFVLVNDTREEQGWSAHETSFLFAVVVKPVYDSVWPV